MDKPEGALHVDHMHTHARARLAVGTQHARVCLVNIACLLYNRLGGLGRENLFPCIIQLHFI